MHELTIISIDDHSLFRSGLELIVRGSFPGVTFVSFASLGAAIEGQRSDPAVVLLDLHLDGIAGDDGIPLLKLRWPTCAVVVVTSERSDVAIARARQRGADAVVLKSEPPERFIEVIRAVAPGESGDSGPQALSRRQREVLQLLREGLSNKAMARRMGISEFTVRGHVQQLLKLLGVSSRAQAVFAAQSVGLL